MNFHQFYDKLNGGAPYEDGRRESPQHYEFEDYVKQITNSPAANTEQGNWELTPLAQDDMARYAADDVEEELEKMRAQGVNPTALGEPLDDERMKKYTGIQ